MNQDQNGYFVDPEIEREAEHGAAIYLSKVMGWMCLGLFTTFVCALLCLATPGVISFITSGRSAIYGIFVVQIVLVLALSVAINKISPAVATVCFMLYAALTGVTMSTIALLFELNSILMVFLLTAAIFLGLSLYGFATKRDLTRIGTLAIFGLIGIILASIVNMFLRNSMLDLIVTCVGILIFIILIAYDTQKIKGIYLTATASGQTEESPEIRKLAIVGAFALYLDFINLFLKLLRILGKRR